jgi:transcriptional regulator with XRE-family HTH domain
MTPKEAIERLQAYRLRMNLNKSALAKLMGVPAPTVKGWLVEPSMASFGPPSEESVRRIERFLSSVSIGETSPPAKGGRTETRVTAEGTKPRESVQRDIPERVARLKSLLLLVAQDLEALRTTNVAGRDLYRNALDSRDIGYLSSLMSMLCDENQFQRWQQFTTYHFRQFKQSEEI